MNKQNITEKQSFQKLTLAGKGSYAPGIKQSHKVVAGFYGNTFPIPVKEALLATKYLQ